MSETSAKPVPDFTNGSIVNLMASLRRALGAPSLGYAPLPLLDNAELSARHVLLLVLDGLGDEFLAQYPDSFLFRHRIGRLTSVFPTTTATALTSYFTGVAPQQHGITGWFTWFREWGMVVTVLPFTPRGAMLSLDKAGLEPRQMHGCHSSFSDPSVHTHLVNPAYIVNSAYSRAAAGRARRHGYRGLGEMFSQLMSITRTNKPTFTFAYWPELDGRGHRFGIGSQTVQDHFLELDAAIQRFASQLAGRDTLLLVSADHGLIDTTPESLIQLDDHPELARQLVLPLCGEPRTAFCYVHARQREEFEGYVRERLGDACDLVPSEQLIADGYFGHGVAHPHLRDRVGDYTLLMKRNHAIVERLPGERPFDQVGVHGGLSEQELYVPLVAIRP